MKKTNEIKSMCIKMSAAANQAMTDAQTALDKANASVIQYSRN